MKKVININFQGRVVPIEETAYDILKQYVDSLSRFFANEEGKDEIINDIEDRIAELFSEVLKKGSTCITDDDVNTIIASMGRPEEFEAEEASVKSQLGGEGNAHAGAGYQSATADIPRGRLYRDINDKILGGVCGGLANYLRIDSSLVRILFAIITFGGFGAGVLLYVLMWIILPKRGLDRNVIRKRLFRNPEDKVIGGVAGGLAAYFNMAVWIPRLIFAFPLVIGIFTSIMRNAFWHFDPFPSIVFGSFGGTLFIVYVILWAVIPEARSASEKLEMKGEKVDLNTIKTTIQEDLSGFKARAEKWGKDAGERVGEIGKEMSDTVRQQTVKAGSEAGTTVRRGGSRILSILGVLIKAFFLVVAGVIAFFMLMALVLGSIKGYDFIPLKDFLLEGDVQHGLVWPTIILFIFTPVIGLIVWLIRRLMKVKSGRHYLGWIFGGLWFIGLICAIVLGTSIGSNFSQQVSEKFHVNMVQPSSQTLTVRLGAEPGKFYPYTVFDDDHGNDDIFMLTKNEDSMLVKRVTVEIAKSDDSLYHVYMIKMSRGKSVPTAEESMQRISFTVNQADSVLSLQKGFAITKDSKFRDQRVAVVVEVPVGKKVLLDENVAWYDDFNLDFDRGYARNTAYDKRTYRVYIGVAYIMTNSGLERVNKENRHEEGYDHDAPTEKTREELLREKEQNEREKKRIDEELKKRTDSSGYRYKPAASLYHPKPTAADLQVTGSEPATNKQPARHFLLGDILMMRFGS